MTRPPLEEVDCALCGSGDAAPEMEKDGSRIVRCRACGLVYVSPRIRADRLAEDVYNEGYFSAEKGYGIEDHFGAAEKGARKAAEADLAQIARFARPPGRLVDVGCAGGYFLDAAREKGWAVMGVEISEYAATEGRKRLGLDIAVGDLLDIEPPSEPFDAMTMLDAVEHFANPKKVLNQAKNWLKPGGLLMLKTPNYDSFPRRYLGARWGLIAPEHHLFYFTPATLGKMLEDTGYTTLDVSFPEFGLTDALLSMGSFQKAGIPIDEGRRRFVNTFLKKPRDAARKSLRFVDRSLLTPFFRRSGGSMIQCFAKRP